MLHVAQLALQQKCMSSGAWQLLFSWAESHAAAEPDTWTDKMNDLWSILVGAASRLSVLAQAVGRALQMSMQLTVVLLASVASGPNLLLQSFLW